MIDKKYKDRSPEDTVNLLGDFFAKMGLEIREWDEMKSDSGINNVHWTYVDAYYQGRLVAHSNGKGTSLAFSRASGYAELFERLMNYANDADFCGIMPEDINQELATVTGFVYEPDEKLFSLQKFIDQDPLTQRLIDLYGLSATNERLNSRKFLNTQNRIIGIPFKDYFSDYETRFYSNRELLYDFVGTTGLCAGNTEAEAINQGVSELIERHFQWELMNGKVPVKRFSDAFLSKYAMYKQIIDDIRQKGLDLYILDCTMSGCPVVTSLLIDRMTHRYHVNIGCFPVFEIALERSLTELLQGFNIESIFEYIPSLIPFGVVDKDKNYEELTRDGIAVYHENLLMAEYTDQFQRMDVFLTAVSNQEVFQYWKSFIKSRQYHLYCRENSTKDFHSLLLCIPELLPPQEVANYHGDYARFVSYGRDLYWSVMDKDISFLASAPCLNSFRLFSDIELMQVKPLFPWLYEIEGMTDEGVEHYFSFVFHFLIEDYETAAKNLDYVVNDKKFMEHVPDAGLLYFVQLFLSYKIKRRSAEEIDFVLRQVSGNKNFNFYWECIENQSSFVNKVLLEFFENTKGAKAGYISRRIIANRLLTQMRLVM